MTFIKHDACSECGSSDANAIYENPDGTTSSYCWSCNTYKGENNNYKNISMSFENYPILELTSRGISKQTAEFFGVRAGMSQTNREVIEHYYPYYKNGQITGWKVRVLPKTFSCHGEMRDAQLFNQQNCGESGQLIILTEGECDAMAAWQMLMSLGKNYRVVSLPNGANLKSIKQHLEWLERFKTVVLCLDQDEVGKKLSNEAVKLFSPGKAKIMSLSEKDANDMLLKHKEKEFFQALRNANEVRPDGIVSGKDTWERLQNKEQVINVPYPPDWVEMNKQTYGMRIGELDVWTSGSGMGKTQVMRELEYHLFKNTNDNIGLIKLEEPLVDSVEAMMSIHLNKRIHLPDVRKTIPDDVLYQAWLGTAGTNRFHYYDHWGSDDDDVLVNKIRYMAKGLDCRWMVIDHLNMVVSEYAADGGEREKIDTIMSKFKRLTQELKIWIGLVVHLRKTSTGGKSFEEGGVPSLDDLRGSGSIKQLANSVYTLARNQQHPDDKARNTSSLHVLKNRFTGKTGPAGYLYFNDETGRMISVDNSDGRVMEF